VSPDPLLAGRSALALGLIGRQVESVVPTLLSLLSTPHRDVEQSVVAALGYLGQDAAPAVPALAERLARPDEDLAREAAAALGTIGPPAATAAIGPLIRALETGEGELPVEAARALGKFDDRAALAALDKATRSADPEVRGAARGALNGLLGNESGVDAADPQD
jgi:HEAT repeat protein